MCLVATAGGGSDDCGGNMAYGMAVCVCVWWCRCGASSDDDKTAGATCSWCQELVVVMGRWQWQCQHGLRCSCHADGGICSGVGGVTGLPLLHNGASKGVAPINT